MGAYPELVFYDLVNGGISLPGWAWLTLNLLQGSRTFWEVMRTFVWYWLIVLDWRTFVMGKIIDSQRCPSLNLGTVNYISLYIKKGSWHEEVILDYPGGSNLITCFWRWETVLAGSERDVIDQESKRCTVRRTHPTVADFEGRRRRLFTGKRGWPLEAGRGKKMNFLLEPPERNTVLLTTWSFLFSLKKYFFLLWKYS